MKILISTWNINGSIRVLDEIDIFISQICESIDNIKKSKNKHYSQNINDGAESPDIIVFGFQEFTKMFSFQQQKVESWYDAIKTSLSFHFMASKYDILRYEQCAGLVIFVAIKTYYQDYYLNLKHIYSAYIGTGVLHLVNKGAIAFMLTVSYQSKLNEEKIIKLCFINSHLTAHTQQLNQRRKNYETICKYLKFSNGDIVFDADVIFWMGDLNYRLYDPSFYIPIPRSSFNTHRFDLKQVDGDRFPIHPQGFAYTSYEQGLDSPTGTSYERLESFPSQLKLSPRPNENQYFPRAVKYDYNVEKTLVDSSLLSKSNDNTNSIEIPVLSFPTEFYAKLSENIRLRNWSELLKYDQLYYDQSLCLAFEGFCEASITFPPTYKYIIGRDSLNLKNWRKHCPSWCDRILYLVNNDVNKRHFLSLTAIVYNSAQGIKSSDHRPVYGFYEINYSLPDPGFFQNTKTLEEKIKGFRFYKATLIEKFQMSVGMCLSSILFINPILILSIIILGLIIIIVTVFYIVSYIINF